MSAIGDMEERNRKDAYRRGYDDGVEAERERVLNEVQDHNDGRLKGLEILFNTPSEERVELAQDRYLKEAYFELTLVGHLIDSLRHPQPENQQQEPTQSAPAEYEPPVSTITDVMR